MTDAKSFARLILAITIALWIVPFDMMAQGITVVGFKVSPGDMTADEDSETARFDQNGDACALIKIQTQETGFSYDVGALGITGDPVQKEGEIWLYVPFGIKRIVLHHQQFGACEYAIPIAVESGKTYIFKITTIGEPEEFEDEEVEFTLSPVTSELYIDGERVKASGGIYKTRLTFGSHRYEAMCAGYISHSGSIEVKEMHPVHRRIVLLKEGGDATFHAEPVEIIIPNTDVRFTMIAVPSGIFMQGATEEQTQAQEDENPVHETQLDAYYIGETEVTQELWMAIMGSDNNPSRFHGEEFPVEQVSWNACRMFIAKLNSVTGRKFRFPTEAEWEYAARGGKSIATHQYSGGFTLPNLAWFNSNSGGTTHTVATKDPNELGIYDMSGNVREWCEDNYADYPGTSVKNPKAAATGAYKVCRGGSWMSNMWNCRNTFRDINTPDNTDASTGLRLAM